MYLNFVDLWQLRRGYSPMLRVPKVENDRDVAIRFAEMTVDPFLPFLDADVGRMPFKLLEFLVVQCGVGESPRPSTVDEDLWDTCAGLETSLSQTIFNEFISREFEVAVLALAD